jgi:transposase-like protein
MFCVPSISGLFKWRQFEPEVIMLAIGWYLRFSLSYRDVEELLVERGLHADHVTVWRWVQRYAVFASFERSRGNSGKRWAYFHLPVGMLL